MKDYPILLHLKSGNRLFNYSELIENAKDQEKRGIVPGYAFYDYKHKEKITPGGWLVFSTWEDGAGVVVKYSDENYKLVRGWQGDFILV